MDQTYQSAYQRLLSETSIFKNLSNVFGKLHSDQDTLQNLYNQLQAIFKSEMVFTMNVLATVGRNNKDFDLKEQFMNNVYIFKENFKLLLGLLFEDIWRHGINSQEFERLRLEFWKSNANEPVTILEVDDEDSEEIIIKAQASTSLRKTGHSNKIQILSKDDQQIKTGDSEVRSRNALTKRTSSLSRYEVDHEQIAKIYKEEDASSQKNRNSLRVNSEGNLNRIETGLISRTLDNDSVPNQRNFKSPDQRGNEQRIPKGVKNSAKGSKGLAKIHLGEKRGNQSIIDRLIKEKPLSKPYGFGFHPMMSPTSANLGSNISIKKYISQDISYFSLVNGKNIRNSVDKVIERQQSPKLSNSEESRNSLHSSEIYSPEQDVQKGFDGSLVQESAFKQVSSKLKKILQSQNSALSHGGPTGQGKGSEDRHSSFRINYQINNSGEGILQDETSTNRDETMLNANKSFQSARKSHKKLQNDLKNATSHIGEILHHEDGGLASEYYVKHFRDNPRSPKSGLTSKYGSQRFNPKPQGTHSRKSSRPDLEKRNANLVLNEDSLVETLNSTPRDQSMQDKMSTLPNKPDSLKQSNFESLAKKADHFMHKSKEKKNQGKKIMSKKREKKTENSHIRRTPNSSFQRNQNPSNGEIPLAKLKNTYSQEARAPIQPTSKYSQPGYLKRLRSEDQEDADQEHKSFGF